MKHCATLEEAHDLMFVLNFGHLVTFMLPKSDFATFTANKKNWINIVWIRGWRLHNKKNS